jgi:osmoprotectant transport system permease protein
VDVLWEALKFIGRNGQVDGVPQLPSLLHLTLEHLRISAIGVALSAAIAVPLGVWLGHLRRGSFLAITVGNVGRALPSLAVLAIGVALLGLGLANVEVALVVLAAPPLLTNAYVAVAGVDREVVDAARGLGMTGFEVVRKVELPLALPLLFAGLRTATLLVIATATITALTGYSGGLGDVIANETSYRLSGVLGGAICVAVLALAVDGLLVLAQRMLTPRGLRLASPGTAAARGRDGV